jgi:CheY-like chemotaxis protein
MSGKRILLVEDDPDVRESCAELLRDLGHTVVAVDDGAVALSEIPRLRPDVILVDLIMPKAELDGVALLSRLAAGPRIPVVILSASPTVWSRACPVRSWRRCPSRPS